MKLAVLGATGPTGKHIVRRALGGGHSVTALVRNPAALADISHDQLKVHKADVFKADDLVTHFRSCDAVISCLGVGDSFSVLIRWTPVTIYMDTIKVIVTAMRTAGVKRLMCMSSACAVRTDNEPWMATYIYRPLLLGSTLKDMTAMGTYIIDTCQDIDFTVVKPTRLTDSPSKGEAIVSHEGHLVPNGRSWMSREDVARFICDTIGSEEWNKKLVAIAI